MQSSIKPKYGDCTKCDKEGVLLYRVKPPECQTCYNRAKKKIYLERQKERNKSLNSILLKSKEITAKNRVKKKKNTISAISKTNIITLSSGERIKRVEFEKRISKAKAKKLQIFLEDKGYYYCEDCKRNDCKPIDCSHDKSVDACIKEGVSELAYDYNNITLRGRRCHKIHDNIY